LKSRKADRASKAAALLAVLLTLALPACGSANESDQARTAEDRAAQDAAAGAKRGVGLKQIGSSSSSSSRDGS
jgi:hypothetical protein